MKSNQTPTHILQNDTITRKTILLRGEYVLLDFHLAELYGIETRVLKQAVKRNMNRFPPDFMFELAENDISFVVSQNVIPHKKHLGGAKPFAFTETGVAMLSSVLKSETAVEVNISVMRTFVALRKFSLNYAEIVRKLEEMKQENQRKFSDIFDALDYLLNPPEPSDNERPTIGFNKT